MADKVVIRYYAEYLDFFPHLKRVLGIKNLVMRVTRVRTIAPYTEVPTALFECGCRCIPAERQHK